MSKARDIASAAPAPSTVSATELGYVDGVTSAIQTQINSKIGQSTAINPSTFTTSGDLIQATGSGTFARLGTGTSGQYLTTNGTTNSWGSITGLPVTWTPRLAPTGLNFGSITSNGSNIFVAVGESGQLYSSTDTGVTWTSRTSGFGANQINSVAYGAGIFVAVGAAGTITSSTDGITWTARTAGVAANSIYCVEFLNSNFVATAAGASGGTGGITTSTDGITWTKRTTPATTSANLYSVTYGNGYYVATGSFSTTAGIYSTNLSTWTALPTSVTIGCHYVAYDSVANTFMAMPIGNNDYYVVSANPSSAWTKPTGNPYVTPIYSSSLNGQIKIYNNRYYILNGYSSVYMGANIMNCSQSYGTASNTGFNYFYQNIPYPTQTTSTANFASGYALFITATGGFVLSTLYGRIYTSF